MREIPPLQVLCLRVVGSNACSAETTFARDENGKPSIASRLLRSFHDRPTISMHNPNEIEEPIRGASGKTNKASNNTASPRPPMKRSPCIGPGSARRNQANEVDLHHPFAACSVLPSADYSSKTKSASGGDSNNNSSNPSNPSPKFFMQHGNPAMDCLQSLVDALVELGRMDDTRLGVHFFEEWKANALIAATGSPDSIENSSGSGSKTSSKPTSKKRRRGASSPAPPPDNSKNKVRQHLVKGSLSLHNCSVGAETIEAMVQSKMGPYVTVLDLSGVNGLTDDLLEQFLSTCGQLECLSIKNCRRVTSRGLTVIAQQTGTTLQSLDIGGVYNITVPHLLEMVPQFAKLKQLHASGISWSDEYLEQLSELNHNNNAWTALSFSYSQQLSQTALRQAFLPMASTLQSISLAFCESVVDNALMGILGRNLPHVTGLDLRGNPSLTTLTGWFDGRVSADLPGGQPLTVLGRYSGLSKASIEETRQVHPFESKNLTVILDGSGTGLGIAAAKKTAKK